MTIRYHKRHYVDFANILSITRTRQEILDAMVELFQNDNPHFREEQFREATGDPADAHDVE